MRKVLLLLDSRGMGGMETHVEHLAVALCQAGHHARVVFLQRHNRHPLEQRLLTGNVPVRYLPENPLDISRVLQQEGPGVLHTHGYKAGVLGRLAARLHGIPVVSTFHASEPGSVPPHLTVDDLKSVDSGNFFAYL
ncbi:MAG: glycosyltransferase [Magnetococcus sp. DMHC-1]|nr:glycosyltransferase [Magnetococcales bacterium]